ncbi:hypothetical protein AGDE_15575 [Angomonas deanei]|uniref:Uncharacterized protein n=1 Tax=Angomonas deanei TaxID=59799 RepID=A0A7G2BZZ9_9TRYP|nr:hypothetical protein AGDE_15575 [Angomonas deanei]CAD2212654.1 hypothetical protein, conserved [Angomonas deanei]|eukprot:EPY18829.1 hypothetical protein AGDE_15575 [Angomonas deanei]
MEKKEKEHRYAVWQLFRRLSEAKLGETVTLGSYVYCASVLMLSAEELVNGAVQFGDGQFSGEDEVSTMEKTVNALLSPLNEVPASALLKEVQEVFSLEEKLELLYVLTAPLVRLSAMREATDQVAARVQEGLPNDLRSCLYSAPQNGEVISSKHLYFLLCVYKRNSVPFDTTAIQLVTKSCDFITALLKSSLGIREKENVFRVGDGGEGHYAFGIRRPLTECDDTLFLQRCFVTLAACSQNATQSHLHSKALRKFLDVLSYTPNYDIDPDLLVEMAVTVYTTHLSTVVEEELARSLEMQLLVVLSRLRFSNLREKASLCSLLRILCSRKPLTTEDTSYRNEWKRLSGLIVQHIVEALPASDVCVHESECSEKCIQLAVGQASCFLLPFSFWCETAEWYLNSRSCSAAVARALFVYRANYSTTSSRRHYRPVSRQCLGILSRCAEIMSSGQLSRDQMSARVEPWLQTVHYLDSPPGDVVPLINEICLSIQGTVHPEVVTF